MKLCISEATTLPATFAEDVAAFADAGWQAMEVWLTKLEQHLNSHSVAATRKLIQDHGLTLAAASYQGGLLLTQGAQHQAHFDHFKRRLDLCQEFGIRTLLLVADFNAPLAADTLEHAVVALKQAAQWAAAFEVVLALEFRKSSSFCSSLDTALALVEQCGQSNVGINLDVFHYYTGPSKFEDLESLSKDRLAFVQMCDVAGVPRELAKDSDRILPGDGDWNLHALIAACRRIGYDGWVSLELLNPILWQTKATQVAELGLAALRRLIPHTE